MMFEAALAARLLEDAELALIVDGRIDWEVRLQGAPLPAITLETVIDPRPQTFKGLQRTRPTRVQVNIWDTTKKGAIALRERVIAALLPPAFVGGVHFQRAQDVATFPRPERTETEQNYREIIDLTLWHDG